MRIIAGKHKGRVLKEFKGDKIRPTSDRAREALFNIFAQKIGGASFLDLFAGTGACGIEALSRGAKRVVFTDISGESISLINQNLQMIKESATVIKTDGINYLNSISDKFDFIFIDPPYKLDLGITALKIIDSKNLLTPNGFAIFESDREVDVNLNSLVKISTRKYGKNHFNIYQNVSGEKVEVDNAE